MGLLGRYLTPGCLVFIFSVCCSMHPRFHACMHLCIHPCMYAGIHAYRHTSILPLALTLCQVQGYSSLAPALLASACFFFWCLVS